ncbi:MAG: hypothetical protein IT328_18735 [Caldilineaceae bacterium]|nr:hypothetical protein [Caldilineaceae bacterium]
MHKLVWLPLLLPWLILPQSLSSAPTVGGCAIFPANNISNTRIDDLPRHARSDEYVAAIGPNAAVHPDFGSGLWEGGPIGIPFVVVPAHQPLVDIVFTDYGDESDPGPYPIPDNAPIEGGADADGDRHVLVLQQGSCHLYELFYAFPVGHNWEAASGAVYDLASHALRPAGWTSADAAGLPILPGLVRYDEVAAGEIRHAIRMTAPETQMAYIWPARHYASEITDPGYPPMGQRFRLRSDFPLEGYAPQVQVILRAMKRYGLILADNGSPWYISGAPDERWDNEMLRELKQLQGSDFEAVDVSSLQLSPDSGEVR